MCATAEEAAVIYQPGLDTVDVGVAGGEVRAANVTDRRITDFQKVCEIEGLAEGAVVEGYTYKSWCTLDLPVNEIMLAGDMELDGDWICLDGTMLGYVLRYPNGSYDPCGWLVLNDRVAQYESYSELVWDEYCSARGLTPLYIVDLRHELGSEENSPFRRFDGDGWYIYLPLSGWEKSFDDIGVFSGPAGGGTAGVTLELMEGPGEDGAVVSRVDADGHSRSPRAADGHSVWRDGVRRTAERTRVSGHRADSGGRDGGCGGRKHCQTAAASAQTVSAPAAQATAELTDFLSPYFLPAPYTNIEAVSK